MILAMQESVLIPVVFESPLTGRRYPESGEVLATLDTGYTGFALVPRDVFAALGLDQLEPVEVRARTADGREVTLRGSYASISIPEDRVKLDGLVETADGVEEILLGMEWAKRVYVVLDGCSEVVVLRGCP